MGYEIEDNLYPVSFSKIIEEQCPHYMLMGMSYDEYFNGKPELARYYRQAYELKLRERNRDLWLQGLYIYEALCDVAPVLQAFAKKGTKVHPYSKEPYCLSEKEQKEREQRKEREKMEQLKKIFASWGTGVNKRMKNKQKE